MVRLRYFVIWIKLEIFPFIAIGEIGISIVNGFLKSNFVRDVLIVIFFFVLSGFQFGNGFIPDRWGNVV